VAGNDESRTPQLSETRCNTLQHTATHVLQILALKMSQEMISLAHCNSVQHTATHFVQVIALMMSREMLRPSLKEFEKCPDILNFFKLGWARKSVSPFQDFQNFSVHAVSKEYQGFVLGNDIYHTPYTNVNKRTYICVHTYIHIYIHIYVYICECIDICVNISNKK